ncbi:MAG: hypothetical protein M3R06_04930, partial [Chloroflexota bacterium]|nr:hypothetical protein [Chloroflexota bacterium]
STLLHRFPKLDDAIVAASALRDSRIQPLALEVTGAKLEGPWTVAVRLEGRLQSVKLLVADAKALIGEEAAVLTADESRLWWSDYTRSQSISHGVTDVFLRCASRPSATAAMTRGVRLVVANFGEFIRCDISPGLGTLLVRVDLGKSGGMETLSLLRDMLLSCAERVTVLAAPDAWKTGLDVWGPPPPGLDVMRSLKEEFDPRRVLNPGRFAGFL